MSQHPLRQQVISEWRKIRSTRTVWGLLIGLVALIALGTIGRLANGRRVADLSGPLTSLELLGIPLFSLMIFSLVMGLRSFTDEFRYGSIVPTLLADPDRRRVLAAKLMVVAAMGALFAVVAGGAGLGIAVAGLTIKGIAIHTTTGAIVRWSAEFVAIGLLWAALGVGVGLAVRHQVAAIVGCLVWIVVGEQLLSGLVPKLARYLPASATFAIRTGGPNDLGHVAAGFVLAAWVAVAVAVGNEFMRRRDIA